LCRIRHVLDMLDYGHSIVLGLVVQGGHADGDGPAEARAAGGFLGGRAELAAFAA